MGATDDTTPDGKGTTPSASEHDLTNHPAPDPGLVRLFVDFMQGHANAEGTEIVSVGPVDAPALMGRDLREGMRAIFEEPGEFQLTGTLHRHRAGTTGQEFWEGALDPHSLVYHIRVAPQTLYDAGPEGCVRFASWAPGRLPEPSSQGGAGDGEDGGSGDAPKPSGPPTISNRMMRTPTPWRLLTLGVEGTWEQWQCSLAFDTVYGEAAFEDGELTVLVDDAREVDARVHVWRLPPDTDYPDGRRVWVAEPAWATVRLIWPEKERA